MKRGSFAAGFLTCLLLAGISTTAYAAGVMAERSTHRIFVDGQEVQMEAYVVNGNNYVKLRDIGEQVGFNVYWAPEPPAQRYSRPEHQGGVRQGGGDHLLE